MQFSRPGDQLKLKLMRVGDNSAIARAILRVVGDRVISSRRKTFPLYGAIAMLALTSKCQCNCEHCGVADSQNAAGGELNGREVSALIRELAALGTRYVYFFGGEPLLIPGLKDHISLAKSLGLYTVLDTNGLLLPDMADTLRKCGLDMARVSLDSSVEEEHDRFRGTNGLFKKVLEGIAACKACGLECHISACATAERLKTGKISELIGLADRLGVKVRLMAPIRCGRLRDAEGAELTAAEIGILKSLLRPGKVYWELQWVENAKRDFMCGFIMKHLYYISPIGNVQPCCYMPVVFGNIRNEPPLDIIRRMWRSTLLEPCKVCDCPTNSKEFKNAFGDRLAATGGESVAYEMRSSPNRLEEWDDWAASYGATADWLAGIQDDELLAAVDLTAKRVLDLGCGTGRFARRLASIAAGITVVDFSPKMLEKARENLQGIANSDFRLLDIANKNAFRGEYDVITALSVMHHISQPEIVVENMKNSLVPGGKIIIMDHLYPRNVGRILELCMAGVSKLGLLSFAVLVARNAFPTSRLANYIRRETKFTFEDFRKRYLDLFPGAEIGVKAGIFAYLEWTK